MISGEPKEHILKVSDNIFIIGRVIRVCYNWVTHDHVRPWLGKFRIYMMRLGILNDLNVPQGAYPESCRSIYLFMAEL